MQGVGVTVTQPGAAAQSGVWHDDLFSCMADPGFCMYTWCCFRPSRVELARHELRPGMLPRRDLRLWLWHLPHHEARRVSRQVRRSPRSAVLRHRRRVPLLSVLDVPDATPLQGREPLNNDQEFELEASVENKEASVKNDVNERRIRQRPAARCVSSRSSSSSTAREPAFWGRREDGGQLPVSGCRGRSPG